MQVVYECFVEAIDSFHQAFMVEITVAFPGCGQPAAGQFTICLDRQGRTLAVEVAAIQRVGALIQDWKLQPFIFSAIADVNEMAD